MSIDVEALRREIEALPNAVVGDYIDRAAVLAILARLVPAEDDPMLGTLADGRHPDHACGQDPCPHIPVPAEDEGRLREAAWFEGYQAAVRDIHHKRPLAATPEPR
jgi:hypothetical protein